MVTLYNQTIIITKNLINYLNTYKHQAKFVKIVLNNTYSFKTNLSKMDYIFLIYKSLKIKVDIFLKKNRFLHLNFSYNLFNYTSYC